jgi:hypothetical protein
MNQKVQELRSEIALLDLRVTEIQSLQHIVKVKIIEVQNNSTAKLEKVRILTETKMADLHENHPKHKIVAEKLAEMKSLSDQRVNVIKAEYDGYHDQIYTLNEKSAALTKEMLKLID